MQNELTETDPGPRLLAQAEITERLQNFSMLACFSVTVADVRSLLDWLASKEFSATCRDAGADPERTKGLFYDQIAKGNLENVRNALN